MRPRSRLHARQVFALESDPPPPRGGGPGRSPGGADDRHVTGAPRLGKNNPVLTSPHRGCPAGTPTDRDVEPSCISVVGGTRSFLAQGLHSSLAA